jgi:formylglycine-generating enzyme
MLAAILVSYALGAGRPSLGAGSPPVRPAALPAGSYQAVTARKDQPAVAVAPYRFDREPVTNAAFLTFVRGNPAWQRGRVPALAADENYLGSWREPLVLGPNAPPRAPVVGVSWFAARAYCGAAGGRLPTEAEWELAGAASPTERDGRRDPTWRQTLLDWYARPNPATLPDVGGGRPNVWGISDLHGLVWEWVNDFGASMLAGDDARLCGGGANGAIDPLDYPAFLRAAFRSSLEGRTTTRNLGFRCAYDEGAPPPGAGAAPDLPAGSLYDLGLRVVGTDGRTRPLDDLRGHPVLASMFFASCATACPLLINNLQRLEAALPADVRGDVRVLVVSFDPKRDSPSVLESVAGQHGLDTRRWRVAAAVSEDAARLLAAVLGIRYRAAAAGMFEHTVRIAVFDRAGRVQARSGDAMALVPALKAATAARSE